MVEPIGPTFCVRPHMTSEKVDGCLKLQKCVSKSFRFFVNFENAVQREDAHREPQSKVEKGEGREASKIILFKY